MEEDFSRPDGTASSHWSLPGVETPGYRQAFLRNARCPRSRPLSLIYLTESNCCGLFNFARAGQPRAVVLTCFVSAFE